MEQSKDGRNWRALEEVTGQGTVQEATSYTVYDRSPHDGYNYYRIKQVDFDGQFAYSAVRSVEIVKEENNTVQVFPNPSKGIVTLTFSGIISEQVQIYNSLGQSLGYFNLDKSGDQVYQLDISALNEGLYYLASGHYTVKLMKE